MTNQKKTIKISQFKASKIPTQSGVYLFINKTGQVIYVGKAVNLRRRLRSYFAPTASAKASQTVKEAIKLTTIIAPSDFEALLLEAKLIKSYQPKYNVLLKDDKHYLYIRITNEDFPRLGTSRKRDDDSTIFGPFPSTKTVNFILKQIRRIFPYRSCSRLPQKPCLYQDLGLCPAVCVNQDKITKSAYKKQINNIKRLLSGQSQQLIKKYEKIMRLASKNQDYETAAQAKKIKAGLEFLTSNRLSPDLLLANLDLTDNHQEQVRQLGQVLSAYFPHLTPNRIEAYDIANLAGQEATGSMAVFTHGQADNQAYRHFRIKLPAQPNDPLMMAEVVTRRLNHDQWPRPDLIVVDGGKPQVAAAKKVLDQKGERLALIGLAKREETIIIKKDSGFVDLKLGRQHPALLLLRAARDEAHRFAQQYHHYLRGKKYQ